MLQERNPDYTSDATLDQHLARTRGNTQSVDPSSPDVLLQALWAQSAALRAVSAQIQIRSAEACAQSRDLRLQRNRIGQSRTG
jgi:hypothetical protein